jgi:hypothetical protein
MNETIHLMDGALHVYRRENSGKWQCSTCLHGRNYRQSTKTDNLILAQDFAKNWYLGLLGKSNAGLLEGGKCNKTFDTVAEKLNGVGRNRGGVINLAADVGRHHG